MIQITKIVAPLCVDVCSMACCRWLDFTHISLIVSRSDIPILHEERNFSSECCVTDYLLWKIRHLVISIRWIFHINVVIQSFLEFGPTISSEDLKFRIFEFNPTLIHFVLNIKMVLHNTCHSHCWFEYWPRFIFWTSWTDGKNEWTRSCGLVKIDDFD